MVEDSSGGCERALINVGGVLYTSEPAGPNRTRMVLSCSTDGGATFNRSRVVNHNMTGGYSALLGPVPKLDKQNEALLMVWENANGNMYSGVIGTRFCLGDTHLRR